MIVTVTHAISKEDYRGYLQIKLHDDVVFTVMDGEPEDNTLNRNFADCFGIPGLLSDAYEAGKAGEDLHFVYRNID